jgi:hypothetical protein
MRRLLCLGVLGIASAVARAEPGFLVTEPDAGGRLIPGDSVWIRWGEIPRGSEEQELLFSLDGGRHFRLLTGKLGPGIRAYRWRVPDLPSEDVVLAVRVGEEAEPGGEVEERIAGRSAIFSIVRGRSASLVTPSPSSEGEALAAAVPPSVSSAAAGETFTDDEDVSAPVPDSWEDSVPLSPARVEWRSTALERADDCVLCPREATSENRDGGLDPSPLRAASVETPPVPSFVRPPSYPRRQ